LKSTLAPRITIGEEYTDNLNQTPFDRESAFITSVSPGLTYTLSGHNATMSLSYDPTFSYYATSDAYFGTQHNVDLTAWDRLSRHSRIELSESFLYTYDPSPYRELSYERTDEPPAPVDYTVRQSTEPYYTNTTRARYRYDFGPSDFLSLEYVYSFLNNDDPTVEDNTRQEPSLGITYWLTPDYGMEVNTRYTKGDFSLESDPVGASDPLNEYYLSSRLIRKVRGDFDVFIQYIQTIVDYDGPTPDYTVYDITAGVDYHLDRSTFFTLSGGYFWRDITEGEPASGYIARGDMAKKFSRGSVRLSGGTGYDLTYFGSENLGFTKFYSASLTGRYDILRHLAGEAFVQYRINDYQDEAGREDTTTTFGARLSHRVNPWLLLALRFEHNKVDSTNPTESYDENRVTFGITMTPASPIPLEW
jgi:hypothetical protein